MKTIWGLFNLSKLILNIILEGLNKWEDPFNLHFDLLLVKWMLRHHLFQPIGKMNGEIQFGAEQIS